MKKDNQLYKIKIGDVGNYGNFGNVTIVKNDGTVCEVKDKFGNVKNVYTSLIQKYFYSVEIKE